jgi:hypothetical protein
MASIKTVAAKQKKNAKLILHIILELANKFGLAIDKNTEEYDFLKSNQNSSIRPEKNSTYSRSSVTVKTC